MRVVYLHREMRSSGRAAISGRQLLNRLRERATVLVAYGVWGTAEVDQGPPERWPDDVLREEAFWAWRPDVVFIEGGVFESGEEMSWRVPREALVRFCNNGGIVIATDGDSRTVTEQRAHYRATVDNRLVSFPFGIQLSWVEGRRQPVTGWDLEHAVGGSNHTVLCRPELMATEDWLKPTFANIDAIVVDHPVELLALPGLDDCLASGNIPTTRVLADDLPVPDAVFGMRPQHCPFATVRALGDGFYCLIAAGVTGDWLLDLGGANDQWLLNVIELLRRSVAAERDLRAPIRALDAAFRDAQEAAAYLDGDAAGQVLARAMQDELDEVIEVVGEHTPRARVERAFGASWHRLGRQCQASLRTAELIADVLREQATTDVDVDFATPVTAYSRALETALVEKLFAPYRASGLPLPEATGDAKVDKSLRDLARFLDKPTAKAPTLDVMAWCLRNIGDRLAGAERNGFRQFLDTRLVDSDAFCRAFPGKLHSYIDRFRNRAAHIEHVSAADVDEARAFLLDDPRLLVWLAESLLDDANTDRRDRP